MSSKTSKGTRSDTHTHARAHTHTNPHTPRTNRSLLNALVGHGQGQATPKACAAAAHAYLLCAALLREGASML